MVDRDSDARCVRRLWLASASTFNKQGQAVRVIVPAYLLLAPVALPLVLNARIITVDPEGVRVVNRPLPKGRNVFVAKKDVRSTSIRTEYVTYYAESGDHPTVKHYVVGVETRGGHIDIAYPYPKFDDAKMVAQKIAAALNVGVITTSLRPVGWEAAQRSRGKRVLVWLGFVILAVFVGAYWEISSSQSTMR